MSTDYNALCFTCKKAVHVGQFMGGKPSFAYGTRSPAYEVMVVASWIFTHVEHGPVMIVFADDTPSTFTRSDQDE